MAYIIHAIMTRDQHAHCQFLMHCGQKNYSDLYTFSTQQYLRLCLYNTMVYFHEAKPCKMFTKMELATNFNFTEVATTRLLLSSYAAGTNKGKESCSSGLD